MSIFLGVNKPKFFLGSVKVKKIYKGSNKVWSGASIVTYVCNGVSTTAEVEADENIPLPSKTITDATFKGWTTDPSNTTPMTDIKATGDPMTLYGIYKWNDKSTTLTIPGNKGLTYSSSISGITTEKYSSAYIVLTQNWKSSSGHTIRCTGCGLSLTQGSGSTSTATQPITSDGTVTLSGGSGPQSYGSVTVYGKTVVG